MNDNAQEGSAEKAAYHADLTQGYESERDANDADESDNDPNERYD